MKRDYLGHSSDSYIEEFFDRHRPKIYVISKYAGDVEKNVEEAKKFCKFVISQGGQPLASHLLYPQFLDDTNPAERKLGMTFGLNMLRMCDEAWCFGEEISTGMELELKACKALRIPVRFFKEDTECK